MVGTKALIKHGVVFIFFLVFVVGLYSFVIWKDIEPERRKVEITATVTQNTVTAGLTAVSVVLPLTVGILGFGMKNHKTAVAFLFYACVFFTFSLASAVYNLFRLPSLVNVVNLANDKATGILEIIQLTSLLYGVVYLVVGARKLIR